MLSRSLSLTCWSMRCYSHIHNHRALTRLHCPPELQPQGCINFMKSRCTPEFQKQALMMSHDGKHANQSVAAFLITRPPIAFLGYGWESDDRMWNDIFLLQVPCCPCVLLMGWDFTLLRCVVLREMCCAVALRDVR